MRIILTLIIFQVLITSFSFGQTISIFDTKLQEEKLTMCDLISKYVDPRKNFEHHYFDTSFYSISSYDNKSEIFGYWTFTARHDSLNQISFKSLDLQINSEWYRKLYDETDSLIKLFTVKYGKPYKMTLHANKAYQKGKKYFAGSILKAMWLIDGQKLKVEFLIDGEHNQFHYSLRVERFKDYYNNMKLPAWWDGY